MRYPFIILHIIFLFFAADAFPQYYDTGQDPASLKWVQIKTGRFTVIYPEKYESEGIKFARSLDDAYSRLGSLFPVKKFTIPVVIHNYTTNSNGYVAWAPRRMEIYPTPEQNSIPLDPFKQLSIHELTHVLQMESLNKGFSKGMSVMLGEQFFGVVAFLMPLWYFEGDAVFAETALTESGRGRSPSFQKELKAISVDNRRMYKYDQIINGSFRHYIPDHYQSGYQMVSWALAKYDPHVWNKVLDFTGKQPFTVNPFNISLSRLTGLSKKSLYKETFDTLKTIWTKGVSEADAVLYKAINPHKKGNYINYYSPVFAGNDSIIAIKTTLANPPSFVLIRPSAQSEKIIHTPGQVYPWYISYGRGKLVWVETQNDPRWKNREYSVIKMMDLHDKKIIRLSKKSRYLSASVSPDGRIIAAVENTISNKNSIVFIDTQTPNVINSIPSPGNVFLQRPQWAEGGEKITAIFLNEEGEGVLSYNLSTQEWEILIAAGKNDLQSTFLRNDSLFFITSLSGTDNISICTPEKKITLLTNSRFGASDLNMKGSKIIFSDYGSLGNNVCCITLPSLTRKPDESAGSASFLISRFDIRPKVTDTKSNTSYTPEPYKKWQHLFKFHSWMPFYANIEEIKADPATIRPGFTLLTQNHLSTMISSISYEYSEAKKNVIHTRITWQGWYPVFDSQLDFGNDPGIAKFGENAENPREMQPGFRFLNAVSVPLRFSTGRFNQYLRPSFTSEYVNNYVYLKSDGIYDYGQTILSGRFYFSNYYKLALRDIYPRWAQTIDLNYSYAPFDRKIYGTEISLKTTFYFPGLFPNNGIRIRVEKEKQEPEKFLLDSRIAFPRGYKNIISRDINFLSVDYVMPLVYPDLNLASILYLKRIRTSLFYDYAEGTGNTYYENSANGLSPKYYHNQKEIFKSFGLELMTDFHIFRTPYMISSGVQTAWKAKGERPSFLFLFTFDLLDIAIGRSPM